MTSSLSPITQIFLPVQLTETQQQLLIKYLRLPRTLNRAEWIQALATFDLLHTGRVLCGNERLTFQEFYLRVIDAVFATAFIETILKTSDVEKEGGQITESFWQQIMKDLKAQGIQEQTLEMRLLLVYCLYWWRSFSKGYIREVAVFHDLEKSGIVFEAHDLLDPITRRSLHDIIVSGKRGDIKTSTYFLHTARAFPLRCDFYIVRLWDEKASQWMDIVMLKPEAWKELNGEPQLCGMENIAKVLPSVAQIATRGENLIVVTYTHWKTCILRKQVQEKSSKGEMI
jgi:hypothetical protein